MDTYTWRVWSGYRIYQGWYIYSGRSIINIPWYYTEVHLLKVKLCQKWRTARKYLKVILLFIKNLSNNINGNTPDYCLDIIRVRTKNVLLV